MAKFNDLSICIMKNAQIVASLWDLMRKAIDPCFSFPWMPVNHLERHLYEVPV